MKAMPFNSRALPLLPSGVGVLGKRTCSKHEGFGVKQAVPQSRKGLCFSMRLHPALLQEITSSQPSDLSAHVLVH